MTNNEEVAERVVGVLRDSGLAVADQVQVILMAQMKIQPRAGKKESKKARAVRERAQSDVIAGAIGRNDIDYSDVESAPTTHVASLDAVGPAVDGGQGKVALENWRASRKPLPKPGERKG